MNKTIKDIGAFVPHGQFQINGRLHGSLQGYTFAAKDLYAIAGYPTGAGNPTWLSTHVTPTHHQVIVSRLLEAGATLIGKTITDELAYSINGDNIHYGTPINSASPDSVPGGSSSGSAAAVAAHLCDFALGTDTGGSTRVPASYCGIWGIRTTHGLLPTTDIVPLCPSFDTATWLAHDATVFGKVGEALIPETGHTEFTHAYLWTDVLAQADDDFHPYAKQVFSLLSEQMAGHQQPLLTTGDDLDQWRMTYIQASAYEAWQTHGEWITQQHPLFSPAVQHRFEMAKNTSLETAQHARHNQQRIQQHLQTILGNNGIAVLPSASSFAPKLDASAKETEQTRTHTFRITSIAGLGGLPQVNIPFLNKTGQPLGISLLGPKHSDLSLIQLAIKIHQQLCQSY